MITPYGGTAAPTGWLICDGTAVSRATYAALFAIVATAFGVGDGSTTFNLPDLRQRFPLGKAAAGTGSTLGGTGGDIDHTHTGPSHTHTGPSHTHSLSDSGWAKIFGFNILTQGIVLWDNVVASAWNSDNYVNTSSVPSGSSGGSNLTSASGLGGATDAGGTGATGASERGDEIPNEARYHIRKFLRVWRSGLQI